MIRILSTDPLERCLIRVLVIRHQLDRRRIYTVGMDGELCTWIHFVRTCSGCFETEEGQPVGDYEWDQKAQCWKGADCDDCGYTGKRREPFPNPVTVKGTPVQVRQAVCHGCGTPIAHFDAGCPDCAARCSFPTPAAASSASESPPAPSPYSPSSSA